MKYLFINTFCASKSTGRIVCDTARELIKNGHQCLIAYGRDRNIPDDIPVYRIGNSFGIMWHGLMTRLFDKHGFCSKLATKELIKKIEEYHPDVIWLHNIHGYYLNIEILFSYIKDKDISVKWSLHDCWALTGHCPHFSYISCEKWKRCCFNCPQLNRYPSNILFSNVRDNYHRKKIAFTGVKRMEVIVVSHWLEKIVKQSYLKDYPISVVYNKVNKSIFSKVESNLRDNYNLRNKKIVLGVATDWTKYKGLYDYYYLSDKLSEEYKVVLIGLTKKQIKELPPKILGIERTNSTNELAEWYSEAFINVVASKEETFGLTILEAYYCGTKSIVYKDTACEEVLNAYKAGIAVDNNVQALCDEIIKQGEQNEKTESAVFD